LPKSSIRGILDIVLLWSLSIVLLISKVGRTNKQVALLSVAAAADKDSCANARADMLSDTDHASTNRCQLFLGRSSGGKCSQGASHPEEFVHKVPI